MLSRSKQDQRRSVKQSATPEESRRKREDATVEIRKNKRVDGLREKRQMQRAPSGVDSADVSPVTVSGLAEYVAAIQSQDTAAILQGTTQLRKLLSIEKNPPIDEVLQSGVLSRLVQLLTAPDSRLQLEASWALTNIASGNTNQTRQLLDSGAVTMFVQLLATSPAADVREQAAWALGNISGDNTQYRDHVLSQGALQALIQAMSIDDLPITMQRNGTWALSNFCRGKPAPKFDLVSPALPLLSLLIQGSDTETLVDACWALSYLSDGSDNQISAVLSTGIAPRLVQLMNSSETTIQSPALRIVGNIVTGDVDQTQVMIDHNILPVLHDLLQSKRRNLRKETAWAVSNVVAGSAKHTQMVLEANIIPEIIRLLGHGEFDVKKEAAWTISNCTTWKEPAQIRFLVGSGCVGPLCDLLNQQDIRTLNVVMEALENILATGSSSKGENPYCAILEEAGALESLESLQSHENEEVYEKAVKLLEDYFGAEEDDENVTPEVANQAFTFGSNISTPSTPFVF